MENKSIKHSRKRIEDINKKLKKLNKNQNNDSISDDQPIVQNETLNENEKKKKRRRFLVLWFVIFTVVVVAAIAYYFIQSNRLNNLFKLNNIDATVTIQSYIIRNGSRIPLKINGDESDVLIFKKGDTDEDNILNKYVMFDNLDIRSNDTLVFFYEFSNTSEDASMYVDFMKQSSDDTNFQLSAYYRIDGGDIVTKQYYCNNGLYYSKDDTSIQGASEFVIGSGLKIDPGKVMTMSIELSPYDLTLDSSCNCNFRFDLINENFYN